MARAAFLTMDDLTDFVSDDALCFPHLAAHGVEVEEVPWRTPTAQARWRQFDIVVIRTPWDYQRDVEAFLGVLHEIAAMTHLENALPLVRWNVRKTYLQALERAGIGVVPSQWFTSGLDTPLHRIVEAAGWPAELVIKPIVSANADHTYRIQPVVNAEEAVALERAFAARPCLVQPFVSSVPRRGEVSIVVFDGRVSHALRKTPKSGDFRVQEEHGGEITSEPIAPWMLDLTARVMEVMATEASTTNTLGDRGAPRRPPLLARIDVVWGPGDEPWIMEVEAIEPSLYLRTHVDAPRHFAEAIVGRLPRR